MPLIQTNPAGPDSPTLRSKSLQKRLLSYAALPTALVLSGGAADAAFIDDYDVSNWLETVGGDGSVNTLGAPNAVELIGSDSGSFALVNVDFTIAAAAGGLVVFDWNYVSTDYSGAAFDLGSFLLNGVATQLTSGAGSSSQSGSFSMSVSDGDIFGFRVRSVDDFGGNATFLISNFDAPAPSAVPEPTTLSLLALGAAGLALTRRRKKQS